MMMPLLDVGAAVVAAFVGGRICRGQVYLGLQTAGLLYLLFIYHSSSTRDVLGPFMLLFESCLMSALTLWLLRWLLPRLWVAMGSCPPSLVDT